MEATLAGVIAVAVVVIDRRGDLRHSAVDAV